MERLWWKGFELTVQQGRVERDDNKIIKNKNKTRLHNVKKGTKNKMKNTKIFDSNHANTLPALPSHHLVNSTDFFLARALSLSLSPSASLPLSLSPPPRPPLSFPLSPGSPNR